MVWKIQPSTWPIRYQGATRYKWHTSCDGCIITVAFRTVIRMSSLHMVCRLSKRLHYQLASDEAGISRTVL